MIDKVLETKIKRTKDFLELWAKFHSLYKSALSKPSIPKEDEELFLHTKEVLSPRYGELRGVVKAELGKAAHGQDVILELLGMESMQALSDTAMERVQKQWKDSIAVLNSVLEELENKNRRIDKISPLSYFIKKITGKI